jgi:hypothetical protein
MRDLEVCQFDVELLGEWFTIKRSMASQLLARRLVTHWIEDLFKGIFQPMYINFIQFIFSIYELIFVFISEKNFFLYIYIYIYIFSKVLYQHQ